MTQAEESLASEVAALRDLFHRRLMDDRDKRRLYEQLAELVEVARSNLERQFVAPIARELVLLLDGIVAAHRAGIDPVEIVGSIYDEVTEILSRRTIEPFSALSQPFDPRWHEAVGQVAAGREAAGFVVEETRAGWRFGVDLLRPARVVVGAQLESDDAGGR
jgi:molecular chaperone GrpE